MSDLSVTIARYVDQPVIAGDILGPHEEVEYEIEVEASISGGGKGSVDSFGVPQEPDSPIEIEIDSATIDDYVIELTPKEIETAEQAVWEAVCDGALEQY